MILASDYDVTLTQIGGTITTKDKDSIKRFRSMNHKFGICSGRSIINIDMKMKQENIAVDFMIGNNGAIAVDSNGKELYRHSFSQLVCEQLLEYIQKTCLCYAVCDGYYYSYGGIGKHVLKKYLNSSSLTLKDMIQSGNVVSFIIYVVKPWYKNHFTTNLEMLFPVSVYRNSFSLDIMPDNINKATGCHVIQQYFNEKMYCIGDGENDLPMLNDFESFAVSRGSDQAKSKANHIVENVADAINYLTEYDCVL